MTDPERRNWVEGQKIEARMDAPDDEPGATVVTYLPEFGDPDLAGDLGGRDIEDFLGRAATKETSAPIKVRSAR